MLRSIQIKYGFLGAMRYFSRSCSNKTDFEKNLSRNAIENESDDRQPNFDKLPVINRPVDGEFESEPIGTRRNFGRGKRSKTDESNDSWERFQTGDVSKYRRDEYPDENEADYGYTNRSGSNDDASRFGGRNRPRYGQNDYNFNDRRTDYSDSDDHGAQYGRNNPRYAKNQDNGYKTKDDYNRSPSNYRPRFNNRYPERYDRRNDRADVNDSSADYSHSNWSQTPKYNRPRFKNRASNDQSHYEADENDSGGNFSSPKWSERSTYNKSNFSDRNKSRYDHTESVNERREDTHDQDDYKESVNEPEEDTQTTKWSKEAEDRRKRVESFLVNRGDGFEPGPSKKPHIPTPKISVMGEVLYGIHPVLLALQNERRKFYALYLKSSSKQNDRRSEIEMLAKEKEIPIEYLSLTKLNQLSGPRPNQGVCADVNFLKPKLYTSDHANETVPEGVNPVWLLLVNIQDPMNLGAMLRSAYFFGVQRVLFAPDNCCPLSPTVCKASVGAMELLELLRLDDVNQFIEERKSTGWSFVGTFSKTHNETTTPPAINVKSFSVTKPTVIVMGNEGEGVGADILNACDVIVNIVTNKDLNPLLNCLNVSAATSIILHSLLSKK